MKVLVTGSSGHLGEALMRFLPGRGHEPVGLDCLPGPCTTIIGSITERTLLDRSLADVSGVIHCATLHKPHVDSHSKQAFIDTNVAGTLTLLEAATAARIERFVFTSTTSAFGDALRPATGAPAVWIDELVSDVPKNIYGVTKTAAESLCALFARNHGLTGAVLRTSRFFPEDDDSLEVRAAMLPDNAKANEFLHRRVDLEDAALAHCLALEQAPSLGWQTLIVSAPSPFKPDDLALLRHNPDAVVAQYYADCRQIYAQAGYAMASEIDRVYCSAKAQAVLGWRPRYDFAAILDQIKGGAPLGSPLAREVGSKGYHTDGRRYP
jgi:UDP-glucose 4-epimerase